MTLNGWRPEFSVGIRELDDEHQELFGLIEALRKLQGRADHDLLSRVLLTLAEYTKRHFYHEERMMRLMHYPGLEGHMDLHRQFTAKVEDFQRGFEESQGALGSKVMDFLELWLKGHILVHDKAYQEYRLKHGITA